MPKAITLWPAFSAGAGDTFAIERSLISRGYATVAGTDEAGRGPLAGPVVAACVILPPHCDYQQFQDSKTISAKARKELAERLVALEAAIGVGIVSAAEIDRLNILQASLLAMRKAVEKLPVEPDFLLVDGKFTVPMALPQKAYVKGDSRSASISAASIVAKVTRDAIMEQYHLEYPRYNFSRHKGYPTAEHRRIIREIGPCPIHRQSFRPVRDWSGK
ncbi:MAG: ribonuclease HII [Desulfurivibrionaceae bacterium]